MSVVVPVEASDAVKSFFRVLCNELGFQIQSASYSKEAFGNIGVLASGQELQIEYRTDRGDETLYVGVHGDSFLVEDVAKLLGRPLKCPSNIRDEENWIVDNLQSLREYLKTTNREHVIKVLKESCRERLHRLFPGAIATQ